MLSLRTLSSYNSHCLGPGMSLLLGALLNLLSFFKTCSLLGTCTSRLSVHTSSAAVVPTAGHCPLVLETLAPSTRNTLSPCPQAYLILVLRSPYAFHRMPPMSFGFSLSGISPLWPLSPGGQDHISSVWTWGIGGLNMLWIDPGGVVLAAPGFPVLGGEGAE